jgi:CRP/FNR family transcriptional regulator
MTQDRFSELKRAAIINTLRSCQLFAGLPVEDLGNVAAITVTKQIEKGELLFREGEPSYGFYIVQRGTINVHRVGPDGKEQVIRVFRAGESFAEATLTSEKGNPADARALEPSQVLLVRKSEFISLLRHYPELAIRMLASMSQHLRALVGLLEDLTSKDVEARLANWLIKRCTGKECQGPVPIELPTTKRLLAAELGTVSETLSRTLAKFREQKLIQVKGRVVTVLSPARLSALLGKHLGE